MSWDNIQTFLQKFNEKTGKQYRLPTEAEWEYACCSGGASEYCGSDNMDSVAWYASNSGRTTHPATIKQANAFGLYDMSGNVREWVQDSYLDSYHGAPTNGSEWQGDGAIGTTLCRSPARRTEAGSGLRTGSAALVFV